MKAEKKYGMPKNERTKDSNISSDPVNIPMPSDLSIRFLIASLEKHYFLLLLSFFLKTLLTFKSLFNLSAIRCLFVVVIYAFFEIFGSEEFRKQHSMKGNMMPRNYNRSGKIDPQKPQSF